MATTSPPVRITGPTALGTDRKRFFSLVRALAVTDFKLKFFGSALGYLWQLMRPLMLFGVLYVVFSQVLDLDSGIVLFPVALLLGLVLYAFFNESTSGALGSLLARETLVRKVDFPRLAVPVSVVVTSVMNLGLNLIAVFVFLLLAGGTPRWSWLQLPLILAAMALLVLGLGMLLAPLFVRYRDVQPIWDVLLQVTLYASPVIYPIQLVIERSQAAATALLCNPFAALLQQARHAVIDPSHPSAADAIGGAEYLLIPAGLTLLVLVVGFRTFRRDAPRIAELL
jgi:ABC-2 type transport system permease protein